MRVICCWRRLAKKTFQHSWAHLQSKGAYGVTASYAPLDLDKAVGDFDVIKIICYIFCSLYYPVYMRKERDGKSAQYLHHRFWRWCRDGSLDHFVLHS